MSLYLQCGLMDFSLTSNEQLVFLLVHELGHNIGLRHTDWAASGESANPDGAIHISGTPNSDNNSVMNSGTCGYVWNGFSSYDNIAIKKIYPEQKPSVQLKVIKTDYSSSSISPTFGFTTSYIKEPINVIGWYARSVDEHLYHDLLWKRNEYKLILFKSNKGSTGFFVKLKVKGGDGNIYETTYPYSTSEKCTIMTFISPPEL